MNTKAKHKRVLAVLLVVGVALTGCISHIHDPWVKPAGTMQVERNVGMNQQDQLRTRLLIGQSDR